MKARPGWLLVSLIASCLGCVTIQSNTKPGAVPTFRRVLVVTKMRSLPDNYMRDFSRAFPTGYEVCTLTISPLSFNNPEESIRKKVESCQSEVILTLELSQRGYSSRYSHSPSEYDAEMTTAATGQPFWKAIISSSHATGLPPRTLVKWLIADHIIEGKLPPAPPEPILN